MSTRVEPPTTTRIEELLVHADWLRHLATRLVHEADPDDLVQETWVAALRSPPRAKGAAAKPWLAEVLRNFLRRRWRTEALQQRLQVSAAATAPPPTMAPDELLARAQLQRELADLVLTLDEPYRDAILLRYFEGKTGAEIAKHLGIPAGTVRWRLSEGLERLRVRLDDRHGDRKRWRVLLAPLCLSRTTNTPAAKAQTAAATVARGNFVTWRTVAVIATVVVVAAFIVGRSLHTSEHRRFEIAAARAPLRAHTLFNPELPASATSIAGVVQDPDGRPVAGAVVSLSRGRANRAESVQPMNPAKTDDAGRFQFQSAFPGTYRATASSAGFKAAISAPFPVVVNDRKEIILRLERGGHTLSGRVLDEGGGPIPNARVTAKLGFPWAMVIDPAFPARVFDVVADAEGGYSFTLDPREYELRVSADGYTRFDTTVALNRSVSRDLVLQPAARVYGKVIEAGTGKPVGGATISLISQDPQSRIRIGNVQSDDEGRFGFTDVGLGAYQVFARAADRNLVGSGPVIMAVPFVPSAPIELVVGVGHLVQGTVVDSSGKTVDGAVVDLRPVLDGSSVRNSITVATDAAGHFAMGGIVADSHQITATKDEKVASQRITVELGKTSNLTLVLEHRPSHIAVSGRVFDIGGRPAVGVMVRLERGKHQVSSFSETDESGQFRLAGGGEGDALVRAWHPALGIGTVSVTSGNREPALVDIRLSAGAVIGGVVRFEDGGPAPGISVALTRQDGSLQYDSATTDENGGFFVRHLTEGTYTVSATRKRGPLNVSTSLERPELKIVRIGPSETRSIDLVVRHGGKAIRGVAVHGDGRPAVGARVLANIESQGRSWKPGFPHVEFQATTDDTGAFALADLDDATYSLWAVLPGHPDGEVNGIAVGRTDVRLVVPNTAAVAGVVVTADGNPVTDYSVKAMPAMDAAPTPGQWSKRSAASLAPSVLVKDSSGRFEIAGLTSGRFDVIARTPTGVGLVRVELTSGERRTGLRLVLEPGVKGVGRVVRVEDATPIQGANISFMISDRRVQIETDKEGHFEIPNIEPGQFIVLDVRHLTAERVPETVTTSAPAGSRRLDFGTIKLLEGDYAGRSRDAGHTGARVRFFENAAKLDAPPPGSPAALAGLKEGDVVLSVADRDVRDLGSGAISYLLIRKPGESVTLTVQTPGAASRTVTLTAVTRPPQK